MKTILPGDRPIPASRPASGSEKVFAAILAAVFTGFVFLFREPVAVKLHDLNFWNLLSLCGGAGMAGHAVYASVSGNVANGLNLIPWYFGKNIYRDDDPVAFYLSSLVVFTVGCFLLVA
jgi:hypothetical protein